MPGKREKRNVKRQCARNWKELGSKVNVLKRGVQRKCISRISGSYRERYPLSGPSVIPYVKKSLDSLLLFSVILFRKFSWKTSVYCKSAGKRC